MREFFESDTDEKRITIYFIGVSFSYIAMVGGLLVFILLIIGIDVIVLGSFLTAYLSSAIEVLITFLYRPLKETGLRKMFIGVSLFFLIISISLFLNHVQII